jgi:hypothetical protein
MTFTWRVRKLWETAQLDFKCLPLRYMSILQPLHHPAQFYWYEEICEVTYSILLGGTVTYTPNQIHWYVDYIPVSLDNFEQTWLHKLCIHCCSKLGSTWHSDPDVNRVETWTYSISWHYFHLILGNALGSQDIWTQKTFYFLSNNEDVLGRTYGASCLSNAPLCMMALANTVH